MNSSVDTVDTGGAPLFPKRSLGLLGFGAFGRFMARHLAPHFELLVYDRASVPAGVGEESALAGVRRVSLPEAARADAVVLAVTMDGFAEVARAAAPYVRPEAVVVDVASVKMLPAAIMREAFKSHEGVIGLHPMFGPQSGASGIRGLRCAMCSLEASSESVERVRAFLVDALGLVVVDTDPESHDREMARVQALTHFISRGLRALTLGPSPLATRAYEQLQRFADILLSDSWELFLTIERANPYAAEVRHRFLEALGVLEDALGREGAPPAPPSLPSPPSVPKETA